MTKFVLVDQVLKFCAEKPSRYDSQIRKFAKQQDLVPQKCRRDGLWYFADESSLHMSPEQGLTDVEAMKWLLEEETSDE